MLGILTLSKEHEHDIKRTQKQIKNSLWSFSANSNGNIISNISKFGVMNMEDDQLVKNKLFCNNWEGMA